jgi:hypothetical protein
MSHSVNPLHSLSLTVVKSLLFFMIIAPLACDEPFPPYDEPANVLTGNLSLTSPDTALVTVDQTGTYLSSLMRFDVNVINSYDNLLQGEARVNGQIVVQSFGNIPRTCLLPLTQGNLGRPPVFQGNIALGPDSSADFSAFWFPLATDGKMVWEDLPHTGGNPSYYGPIRFIASAEVQIFDRIQAIRFGQLEFEIVFKVTTQ